MRYCVILAGRLPGEIDDAVIWAPVAAALKLDAGPFAERVLAALPLVIRQNLDQDGARRLAERLRQTGVDARVLPDDIELAYLERDGRPHGPLPLSGLGAFIEAGERYRLRGSPEWRLWPPGSAPEDSAETGLAGAFAADATAVLALLPSGAPEPTMPAATESSAATAEMRLEEPPSPPIANDAPSPGDDPVAAPPQPAEPPPAAMRPEPPLLGPPPVPRAEPEVEAGGTPNPPEPPSGGPAMRLLLPVGRSGLAIAAGYLGLLAVTVVIAPITLLVSLLAWRDLRRHPGKLGWGRTIFGLVMGVLFTLLLGYVLNAGVPAIGRPTPTAALPHAPAHPKATTAPQPKKPVADVPIAPKGAAPATDGLTGHCESAAPQPRTPEERLLVASGQRHLVGKALRGGNAGDIYVVEAALGYDGMCRPSPYQIYLFRRGEMVGTLAPAAMQARSDGAIVDFRLVDPDHLQLDIEHYKPEDPLCCASSHEQRVIALSRFVAAADVAGPAAAPTLPNVPTLIETPAGPSATAMPTRDCASAASPGDRAICSDDALRKLDTEQARLYRQTLADASPEQALALEASQQEWLQLQPQLCAADKACMERGFHAHIDKLKRALQPSRIPASDRPAMP